MHWFMRRNKGERSSKSCPTFRMAIGTVRHSTVPSPSSPARTAEKASWAPTRRMWSFGTGKKASSDGFVTRTSAMRMARSVQRKASKWLVKRNRVTGFHSAGSEIACSGCFWQISSVPSPVVTSSHSRLSACKRLTTASAMWVWSPQFTKSLARRRLSVSVIPFKNSSRKARWAPAPPMATRKRRGKSVFPHLLIRASQSATVLAQRSWDTQ
mmetsp:Transcript_88720/g.275828  ORF Transcript_88720/g.275828 Transcript_88720/m.275828 type:complete len:212 (-) Transcript_88720:941-1576(-)